MADPEIPAEVIQAQRAFDEAAAAVHQLVQRLPAGADVAAGKVVISEEPYAALAAAQARQHEALADLLGLPWWETVESPIRAERALRRAARQAS